MNRYFKNIFLFFLIFFCCPKIGRAELTETIKKTTIRVGFFPNIIHAQALIGLHLEDKQTIGRFKKALGNDVEIKQFVFNAGPSAIEALFADAIDLAYIGPTPAINAWLKSGKKFKIISGVASGGSRLIFHKDSAIKKINDFKGKKIATPQYANTQDIAARNWFANNGFKIKGQKSDIEIIPIKNSDQFNLFKQKKIDATWTTEPWGTKLLLEANGSVFLDEKSLWPDGKYTTALILVSNKFYESNPQIIKKWLSEHVDLTLWINSQHKEALEVIHKSLLKTSRTVIPKNILSEALKVVEFTYDPLLESLKQTAQTAHQLGFLSITPEFFEEAVDITLLNEVLKEKGQNQIKVTN